MRCHLRDRHTEGIQRIEHHARIVRVKHVAHACGCAFFSQSGEQQHTVGNAFRAGQGDFATGVTGGVEGELFHSLLSYDSVGTVFYAG